MLPPRYLNEYCVHIISNDKESNSFKMYVSITMHISKYACHYSIYSLLIKYELSY